MMLLVMDVDEVRRPTPSMRFAAPPTCMKKAISTTSNGDWPLETASLNKGGKAVAMVGFVSATAFFGPDHIHWSVLS